MKKAKDLDVDFIGGQSPLTKEEESALSAFFSDQKSKKTPLKKGKQVIVQKISKKKIAA